MRLQGIDVDVVRKGSGQALLMLHGGGGPVAQHPVIDKLAGHFDVIAPTHPGFDGSQIPDHFDAIDDLVFLILDLLEVLDLRDVILVGFSMGGWIATELATMTTERLSKLLLVSSVGIKVGGREDRDIADIFAMSHEQFIDITYHDPSLAPQLTSLSNEQAEIMAANRIALGAYTWEPYMHNPKLVQRLHRIDIPTHFIWGASDGLVTVDYGRAFCSKIRNATMDVIEHAGHSPHIEQPERFLDCVLKLLR